MNLQEALTGLDNRMERVKRAANAVDDAVKRFREVADDLDNFIRDMFLALKEDGDLDEQGYSAEVLDVESQAGDDDVPFLSHEEREPESKAEWITTALKIRFPDVRVHEPSEDEAERIFAKVGGQEHLVEYLDYMRELADTGYAITSPLGFLRHLTKNYDLARLQNQRDDLREEGMDHSALVRAAMKQADRKIRSQPAEARADTSRGKRFSQMREKVGAST